MGKKVKITKGFDIKIVGSAKEVIKFVPTSQIVAIKPSDFKNSSLKLLVTEGEEVLAGQKLFFDKNFPDIFIPSPVSGEIVEIIRVEKRRISHIKILADKNTNYKSFIIPSELNRHIVKKILLESGCWSYIRQRPYDSIPSPESIPKSIFVSLFDTGPLAPDYSFLLKNKREDLNKGLEILGFLSLDNLNIGKNNNSIEVNERHGMHVHKFIGPHPSGNVGIHIHHIDPLKQGQTVWYVNVQDVAIIGKLFNSGQYHAERTVALVGSGVIEPSYYEVMTGSSLDEFLDKKILEDNQRIIQGNILTGKKSEAKDSLSFYTNQITIISEGNHSEFFGWLLPGFRKLSVSRSFFSWLNPKKTYNLDTNTHGEERPFVVTGQYEKVLPMNILPVVLLKSILAQDIERMEQLGIYEVSEEDFALCEFVCTSKIEVQRIISDGLELIRKEG